MNLGIPASDEERVRVLHRMVKDARVLAERTEDPVMAPRGAFLVAYLLDTLQLAEPSGDPSGEEGNRP